MSRRTIVALMLFIICAGARPTILSAQAEFLDPDSDIDSMFEDDGDVISDEPADKESSPDTVALTDLVRGNQVTLEGAFSFSLAYTAGWTNIPWLIRSDGGDESFGGFRHGALTDTKSSLSLKFRIAPSFRSVVTFGFAFPTFEPEISEFFADYSLYDTVFFRAGRHTITWGISRFHPQANLTARLPDSFPVVPDEYDDELNDADAYAFKMSVPVGNGGFEFIGFTRNGFMADPSTPAADEIGWGGTFNLAVPYLDCTIGSYYQSLMDWRSFMSASTTLWGRLELYSEGVVSTDFDRQGVEYGVDTGFLLSLWNTRFQLSGEYFYTNETADLRVKGMDYPLIPGHNVALGLSSRFLANRLRLYGQVQYNVDERSGLAIPALTLDAVPFVTLTGAVPVIFGDGQGTYFTENPEINEGRVASFIIGVVLNASF